LEVHYLFFIRPFTIAFYSHFGFRKFLGEKQTYDKKMGGKIQNPALGDADRVGSDGYHAFGRMEK
jgi:hypothetical protein